MTLKAMKARAVRVMERSFMLSVMEDRSGVEVGYYDVRMTGSVQRVFEFSASEDEKVKADTGADRMLLYPVHFSKTGRMVRSLDSKPSPDGRNFEYAEAS